MDGEQRLLLLLSLVGVILLTILGLVLLIALWPYRIIIGSVLAGLLLLLFLLIIGIAVNEQVLRHKRVKYGSELPLGCKGQPFYLPKDMQVYPQEQMYE